jgi:2-dehydro-3-deoxygluconokinase
MSYMTSLAIAVLGECMIELKKTDDVLSEAFAGDTINTAIYLKRNWSSRDQVVSYVTALGEDSYSEQMREFWYTENIKSDLVLSFEQRLPGLYRIETDDVGERTFNYWRSESAARFLFQHPDIGGLTQSIHQYDFLFLSGISLAILPKPDKVKLLALLTSFKEQGGHVVFDNNYRPLLWASVEDARYWFSKVLPLCDTCLFSFDDELAVYGEHSVEQCIERVRSLGVNELILKRGGLPCIASFGDSYLEVGLKSVSTVLDTTAAGDSFNGGYLSARLTGSTVVDAIKKGHALASVVIQHPGAIIPMDAMPAL